MPPLSTAGVELLFEVLSRRYERGSILVTTNLPFDEWTQVFGSERLTGALLDRLTHHVPILRMKGDSYRRRHSGANAASQSSEETDCSWAVWYTFPFTPPASEGRVREPFCLTIWSGHFP